MLSTNNSNEKWSSDRVWRSEGYFSDTRPELNLEKKNIPENCLIILISLFFKLLWTVILLCIVTILFWGNFSLQPTNLLKLKPILIKENEVKLHTRLYDLTTGEFQGLQTELAFIMLRGDNKQAFFFFFVCLWRR